MKNFIHDDNVVEQIAPVGGVTSGVGVLIGQLFGVAQNTAAATESFGLCFRGVVSIKKTSALALAAGAAVYWDDTAKEVNATSASQKEVGVVLVAAGNPSATVEILLVPTVRTSVAA